MAGLFFGIHQRDLFTPRQTLDLRLALRSVGTVSFALAVNEFHRKACARALGTCACIVLIDATLEIIGDTRVESTIATLEYVDMPAHFPKISGVMMILASPK